MPFKSIQRRHGRTNTRTWHWKKIISAGRFRERDPRAFATMTSQYGRIYPRCSERNWWQHHDDGIIAIILDHLPSIIGRPRRRNAREGRVSEKRFHVWPKKMISERDLADWNAHTEKRDRTDPASDCSAHTKDPDRNVTLTNCQYVTCGWAQVIFGIFSVPQNILSDSFFHSIQLFSRTRRLIGLTDQLWPRVASSPVWRFSGPFVYDQSSDSFTPLREVCVFAQP